MIHADGRYRAGKFEQEQAIMCESYPDALVPIHKALGLIGNGKRATGLGDSASR